MSDPVELELPADRSFDAVGRQVVAGVGTRLGLTVDQTEDLQHALEAVFAQPTAGESVKITLSEAPDGLRVEVGPIVCDPSERRGLERVLSALVDDIAVDDSDGSTWISMWLAHGPVASATR